MKKIELTQDKYALVDDKNFKWLSQWKWSYHNGGYATRDKSKILMHRLINNTPEGFSTDHINQDKLDNRRSNLRTANKSQNAYNSRLFSTNKSGHRGVFKEKSNNWSAYIHFNYRKINLGTFSDLESAIEARKEAEKIYVR